MITKIAFVSYPCQDLTEAKKFWVETLGLKHAADYAEGKWSEVEGPDGKTIALDTFAPEGSPPYLALETDDIDAEMKRLKEAGVKVVRDTWENEGACKMALILDPAGHTLMLHEIDASRVKGGS